MAVILRSNMPYRGNIADLPPINAPMPRDAAFYGDFLNDLYVTEATRGADPTTIFSFAAMRSRYLRNAAGGYTMVAEGASQRPEYGADGSRLGMLVEASSTQSIASAQRQDLTQGAANGLTVSAGAATTPTWDRWFTLTPSGDAAHDLALASTASITANYRRTFAIEFRSAGHRYVQLSSGGGSGAEATDYANFDLQTKAVTAQGAGVTYAGIVPTIEGAICYIQYASAIAAVETPTISIIANGTAGKQASAAAASVGAISARLPKLRAVSVGPAPRVSIGSPMPSTTSTVADDQLEVIPALVTGDYTILGRARNSPWLNSINPALWSMYPTSGTANGASLRIDSAGEMALVTRSNGTATVTRDFSLTLPPNQITDFAISKQGNVLRIALPNGETFEGDVPQIAGGRLFILSSPLANEGFDGHLQRIVGWQHGKPLAELQALVAEGI